MSCISMSYSQPVRMEVRPQINGDGCTTAMPASSSSSSCSLAATPPLSLLQRLTQQPSPAPIPKNTINLTYLHGFLSGAECDELISSVTGCYSRSRTTAGVSDSRTSDSASPSSVSQLVRSIRMRVCEITNAKESRIEDIAVVRYVPGQRFTPHYDSSTRNGVLRQYTFFAYLNDVAEGGETEFTKLDVKFKPKKGDALFWQNHTSPHVKEFEDGEHAGRPPIKGTKYGLNIWVEFE